MPDLVSFLTALPVFSPITLLATAGSSWQLPPLVATMFAHKKKMLLVEERKSLVATKNLLGNVDNITSILIISTILFCWRCLRALYHCDWIQKWSDRHNHHDYEEHHHHIWSMIIILISSTPPIILINILTMIIMIILILINSSPPRLPAPQALPLSATLLPLSLKLNNTSKTRKLNDTTLQVL